MSWESGLDIASALAAIFVILYYFGFILYMIYLVFENWIYIDEEYIQKCYILI